MSLPASETNTDFRLRQRPAGPPARSSPPRTQRECASWIIANHWRTDSVGTRGPSPPPAHLLVHYLGTCSASQHINRHFTRNPGVRSIEFCRWVCAITVSLIPCSELPDAISPRRPFVSLPPPPGCGLAAVYFVLQPAAPPASPPLSAICNVLSAISPPPNPQPPQIPHPCNPRLRRGRRVIRGSLGSQPRL